MSDIASDSGGDRPSGPNRGLIAVVAVALVGAVVAAIALIGGDDDESNNRATTVAPETSAEPDTTEGSTPPTEAPTTSDAPATTTATETTATTEAPETTDAPPVIEPVPAELSFVIGDIEDGGTIPVEFTCDGDNTAPTVEIDAIPEGVLQLAMLVDDPDAPTDDPFVHWVVYDIPGNSTGFTDGDPALTYGTNDVQLTEWFGPCPPAGDGPHGYVFALYGLDRELSLDPGLDGRELLAAIDESVVTVIELAATFERP